MPSSGKTQNFGLNQWIGTDSIKVADLNADNRKIDAAAESFKKTPYIGGNGNWFIWDVDAGGYVDSGKTSQGADGPQGPPGPPGGILKINGIEPDEHGEAIITADAVGAAIASGATAVKADGYYNLTLHSLPPKLPEIFSVSFTLPEDYVAGDKIRIEGVPHLANLYGKGFSDGEDAFDFAPAVTIHNFLSDGYLRFNDTSTSLLGYVRGKITAETSGLKTNTQYTIVSDVKDISGGGLYYASGSSWNTGPFITMATPVSITGIHRQAVISKSSFSQEVRTNILAISTASAGEVTLRRVLLEGDYTTIDLPADYWEDTFGEYDLSSYAGALTTGSLKKGQTVTVTINTASSTAYVSGEGMLSERKANYDNGTYTGSIVTVYAPHETTAAVTVHGKTQETLADPNAEKSPDNPATITGVGENGSIELLSNGKNFWRTNITYPKTTNGVTLDYDTVEQTYTLNGTANGLAVFFVAQNGFFTGFRWKSSTKYSAKIYMQSGEKPSGVALNISSGRFNAESEFVMTEGSKATPQNMTQNLLRPSINVNSGITVNNLKFKVMFCEGEMPTVWEPYLQKKFLTTSFLPLYSLPDGTRDTLDVETGTITRRIVRRTFNGTEAWKKTGATNRNNFFLYDTSIKITFTNYDVPPIYCDKLSVLKLNDIMVSQDLTPNAIVYDEPTKDWRIALSPTIANTDSAFKMWLNQNPLTVIYALSEPTIEKVPPHLLPIYANTANIYTTDPLAPELTATVLEPRPVSSARRLDGYAAAQMSDLLARVQALESGTNLMTTIIADTAESEYQKAMEEITNV